MIKYKLSATIPVVSYGNIVPEIELEGDSVDELHATAMAHISEVWGKYGERPLKALETISGFSGGVVKPHLESILSFTGETILYDKDAHKYFDQDGNVLLSGSAYAESMSPKFDKAMLLPKTAKAWGVEEMALDEIWNINGRVSNEYGSAIHSALELWHRYKDIGAKIQEQKGMDFNYVLPKNEHIRNIVLAFDEVLGKVGTIPEVLITDVKNKRAGRVDLLEILDETQKVCRIGDYKTNNDLDDKKIKKYQHQLSFYADILQNHGWSVSGLDIFHYTGSNWEKIELDVVPIKL